MGFGSARAEARQLVSHAAVLLNGKKNNIPSAGVKPNDTISLVEKAKAQLRVKSSLELAEQIGIPDFQDAKKMEGIYEVPDKVTCLRH